MRLKLSYFCLSSIHKLMLHANRRFLVRTIYSIILIFIIFQESIVANDKPYFQQDIRYEIDVNLNDRDHSLQGKITIIYKNNSPDALNEIYFHLWPDAYRNRETQLSRQLLEDGRTSLYFADEKERGYIDGLSFTVNNISANFNRNDDTGVLQLPSPLNKGDSVIISTPFYVKIPSGRYSRLGHIGNSYQVTQWYPKPAVYDRDGWHVMSYLDRGEFYSEFGSYRVSVTLPENYLVAATGVLQNQDERDRLLTLADKTKSKTEFEEDISFPPSSADTKTLVYFQDSIHDFAWFADKRFHVLMDTLQLPGGRTTEVWSYFTNREAELWKKSIDYLKRGVHFYSGLISVYPFQHFTAVDGTISAGGGMEYPMITLMNHAGDDFTLEDVLIHELAHSWFYGIAGFNERDHGWLDEGLASYYELLYNDHYYPGDNGNGKNDLGMDGIIGAVSGTRDLNMREAFGFSYNIVAYNNSDQPLNLPSVEFTRDNYGAVMYRKAALAFDFLHDYLGAGSFNNAMKSFMKEWQFRHPGPGDLHEVFRRETGKELDWFFKNLVSTNYSADYRPVKFAETSGSISIKIKNSGSIATPFKICNESGQCKWFESISDTGTVYFPFDAQYITINREHATLLKSPAHAWYTRNFLKIHKPVDVNFLPEYGEQPGRSVLNVLPVAGWNEYNKWMAGVNITNMTVIPEKFEYSLTPLYDFRNSNIAGLAWADYNMWPFTGPFREIKFSADLKRFAYAENRNNIGSLSYVKPVFNYSKAAASVNFLVRNKNATSSLIHNIRLRNIGILLEEEEFRVQESGNVSKKYSENFLNFSEVSYSIANRRTLDPYSSLVRLEQAEHHLKLSGEFIYKFSYAKFNKGITARFFAGGFLVNREKFRNYNFRMSGWNGSHDYLFDELYFGRTETEGILSQQFLVRDGGFAIPTFVGQSNKWIAAVNLSVDVPFPLPVKLFFDIGTYEGISTVFPDLANKVMYDGGLCISAGYDIFEIYIPFIASKDIERNHDAINLDFMERIRFVFNLNKMSPKYTRNRLLH